MSRFAPIKFTILNDLSFFLFSPLENSQYSILVCSTHPCVVTLCQDLKNYRTFNSWRAIRCVFFSDLHRYYRAKASRTFLFHSLSITYEPRLPFKRKFLRILFCFKGFIPYILQEKDGLKQKSYDYVGSHIHFTYRRGKAL